LSGCLVYAMKVSDKKTLREYDAYCQINLPNKVPKWFNKDWRKRLGDCVYDFSKGEEPTMRTAIHTKRHRAKDLRGGYALLSNHFYYFGEEPRPIPAGLKKIVKKTQGHLVFEEETVFKVFEKWISKYQKNKLYAEPQRGHLFRFSVNNCGPAKGNQPKKKEKRKLKRSC